VRAAVAHAGTKGWEVCAAVCDPTGHLVALLRTADVVVPAIDYAIDKAYTAACLRTSTQALFERAQSRPALGMGLANRPRVLVFPGGLPIRLDGRTIGGLGVSGAADAEDVECAEAALGAVPGLDR
jgi:uncharacterized protein GlcG (DUF336 family)